MNRVHEITANENNTMIEAGNYRFTKTTIAEAGNTPRVVFSADDIEEYSITGEFTHYVIEDQAQGANPRRYTTWVTEYQHGEYGTDLVSQDKEPGTVVWVMEKIS